MPRICLKSPEIESRGEIQIHARVAVKTTAKLDSINVSGDCKCDGAPVAPDPIVEMIFVIDGSDSFNRKTSKNEQIFSKTCDWVTDVMEGISSSESARVSVSVVQFSGVNQLEKSYIPGNLGATESPVNMFQVEVQGTPLSEVTSIKRKMRDIEHLDGNGQLFLCLQDLCMDKFLENLSSIKAASGQARKRVLIIVSDPEWDCKKLRNGFGSGYTTGKEVCAQVHKTFDQVFPVILRAYPGEHKINSDFINRDLANGRSGNVNEIYLSDADSSLEKARRNICSSLRL